MIRLANERDIENPTGMISRAFAAHMIATGFGRFVDSVWYSTGLIYFIR